MTLFGTNNERIRNERREAAIARGIRKLENATEGIEVTLEERRTPLWLAEWESQAVDNLVSIIQKAKSVNHE